MKHTDAKIGDEVRVIGNAAGHGFNIGERVRVVTISTSGITAEALVDGLRYNLRLSDAEAIPKDRKEKLKQLDSIIQKADENISKLKKERDRLKKYDSDEAEAAAAMVDLANALGFSADAKKLLEVFETYGLSVSLPRK